MTWLIIDRLLLRMTWKRILAGKLWVKENRMNGIELTFFFLIAYNRCNITLDCRQLYKKKSYSRRDEIYGSFDVQLQHHKLQKKRKKRKEKLKKSWHGNAAIVEVLSCIRINGESLLLPCGRLAKTTQSWWAGSPAAESLCYMFDSYNHLKVIVAAS